MKRKTLLGTATAAGGGGAGVQSWKGWNCDCGRGGGGGDGSGAGREAEGQVGRDGMASAARGKGRGDKAVRKPEKKQPVLAPHPLAIGCPLPHLCFLVVQAGPPFLSLLKPRDYRCAPLCLTSALHFQVFSTYLGAPVCFLSGRSNSDTILNSKALTSASSWIEFVWLRQEHLNVLPG